MEKKIVFQGQTLVPGTRAVRASSQAAEESAGSRIFLLSPASAAGARARLLLNAGSQFELVVRLRTAGAQLGEIFSFMSSLYFRGKLTYAQRFAVPPKGAPGVLVITPSRGLLVPEYVMTLQDLEEMTRGDVHHENENYRRPLMKDAQLLIERLEAKTEVVLLGSIATPKYVTPLLEIFGDRLVCPADFVGIGDMSRGGLLLECFREEVELKYVPVVGAKLSSARPKTGSDVRRRAKKIGA